MAKREAVVKNPDCVLLTSNLPVNEFMYHASLLFSMGGLILSSYDSTTISVDRLKILKKVLPPTGASTSYNNTMDIGWMKTGKETYQILLNKADSQKKSVPLTRKYVISNYWSDEKEGIYDKVFDLKEIPAHCDRVTSLKL